MWHARCGLCAYAPWRWESPAGARESFSRNFYVKKEFRRFESHYRRWLRRSYFVVLSGRNAVGTPVDWYARLVRLARREGVPAAVDTSGAALAAALQAKPFLIKPHLSEAE